ncbi:hypothetical protein [Amycolatopsis sp. NPDC004378]
MITATLSGPPELGAAAGELELELFELSALGPLQAASTSPAAAIAAAFFSENFAAIFLPENFAAIFLPENFAAIFLPENFAAIFLPENTVTPLGPITGSR